MSRDYIFILSRDFMHFGSCYFKLINEQKKELYKNVLCHRFSTFITVCKTHKTERFVMCSEPISCDPSINSKTILTSLIQQISMITIFFLMYSFTAYNIICLASKTIEHVHIIYFISTLYFSRVLYSF